jgi:integrase
VNAAIIKRGNRYAVRLCLGRGPDGKRIYRWHSGYATKRAAQQARTELLGALDRSSYVPPDKTTVAEYLRGQWLPAVQTRVRPGDLGGVPPKGRDPPAPHHRSDSTAAAHHRHAQRALPAATDPQRRRTHGQYVHATIRKALNDAVRWGLLVRNPALHAAPPTPPRTDLATWTAEELHHFLESIRGERLYAAWRLAALTGMRRGEVLGLRWADLDLDAGWLSVSHPGCGRQPHPGLPAQDRSRPPPHRPDPATITALHAHHKTQAAERLAVGPTWPNSDLVFTRHDGAPLHPEYVRRRFDRCVARAGLPRIRLHDLRHTHATLALQAGVHPKVISERLGHATVAITLDIYSHAIPALQQDAAAIVADLVTGVMPAGQV